MERNSNSTKTKLNKSSHMNKKGQPHARNKVISTGKYKTLNASSTTTNIQNNGTINNYNISIYPDKSNLGMPDITDCGIDEINEIIKKTANMRRQYSKTYAEQSYTPLTLMEKKKFVEDFSMNSQKRLHLYSELFKEIKTQISVISNNLSTTLLENEKDRSGGRNFCMMSGTIDEENDILSDGNDGLIKKKSSKISNKTKTPKNKIIKIDNPSGFNMIVKKESEMSDRSKKRDETDCNCLDGDENIAIIIPVGEYRSNYLKDIDTLSTIRCYSHSASESHLRRRNTNRNDSLNNRVSTVEENSRQTRKLIYKENDYYTINTSHPPRIPFISAKRELNANITNQLSKKRDSEYNQHKTYIDEENLKPHLITNQIDKDFNNHGSNFTHSTKCIIY